MLFDLPGVIAHRGASRVAPENTLASMRQAKYHAASCIEFDVMLTRDDEVIVFHDEVLQRTSNGRGKVADTDYATIKTLDAGSWFHPDFTNEVIPTLAAYLAEAAVCNLAINIELKSVAGKESILAAKLLRLLDQHWSSSLPKPLLSSFSYHNLLAAKQLSDRYPLGLNVRRVTSDVIRQASDLNCYSIHVKRSYVNKEVVEKNSQMGFKTLVYTVNSLDEATALFDIGVVAVFSDNESLFSLAC